VYYEPFGEATSSGAPAGSANYTRYQWNGGDALAAFGLSQLGARLYDAVIGRFLSRDPLLNSRFRMSAAIAAARSFQCAFARGAETLIPTATVRRRSPDTRSFEVADCRLRSFTRITRARSIAALDSIDRAFYDEPRTSRVPILRLNS